MNEFIDQPDGKKKQRYVFDETMKSGDAMKTTDKDKLNRGLSVEKFKIMKKILSNEKKVSHLEQHFRF